MFYAWIDSHIKSLFKYLCSCWEDEKKKKNMKQLLNVKYNKWKKKKKTCTSKNHRQKTVTNQDKVAEWHNF